MTAPNITSRIPSNTDGTRPPNFQVVFARMPLVTYFCQSAQIPGVQLGVADFHTPFVHIPEPGEIVTFEPFSMTFQVAEDLSNWAEIFNWIMGLGFPKNFEQFQALDDSDFKIKSDFTLTIMSNALNATKEVRFYNGFPISLSALEYTTTNDDSGELLTSTIQMRYSHYELKGVGETA